MDHISYHQIEEEIFNEHCYFPSPILGRYRVPQLGNPYPIQGFFTLLWKRPVLGIKNSLIQGFFTPY